MYRKSTKGLLKHIDFMVIDLLCLELSFFISYYIRQKTVSLFDERLYGNMFIVLFLIQITVTVFCDTYSSVLKRGYYQEFLATVKNIISVMLLSSFYLFLMQQGLAYSRFILIMTGCLYLVSSYVTRLLWKKHLRKKKSTARKRSLLIATTRDMAEETIERVLKNNFEGFFVSGIVLLDEKKSETSFRGIPVVADQSTVVDYIGTKWVDEVFINLPSDFHISRAFMDDLTLMGVTVHVNLAELQHIRGKKQFIESLSSYTVLTSSVNAASGRQLLAKRFFDICGGLVGCFFTLIFTIIIGPIIYIQSPGPIFFSQERIGKNGRTFKLYKFRSMYMDAEERKKELMKQNKVKDGLMFKMDNDPRIIGSEKGPGKGIGNFIRKTSIDEFPQFWNVLKGDMSLCGTRPPLPSEVMAYEPHHRARLAIKPGMTGMWQVSGRSDITDFEEVVKLDVEYIENWSLGLDIKLLFKTIALAVRGEGAM